MNKLLTLSIIISFAFAGITRAGDNGYATKVIHETDQLLSIAVQPRKWIKITNFIQEGGNSAVGPGPIQTVHIGSVIVYQGASGLPGITVATAGGANSSQEVFIAGPAIVNVAPVPGGTLFLTFQAGNN